MRKLVRFVTFALLGCAAAALAFSVYVYAATTRILDQRYPVAGATIAASSGPDAIARGKALADRTGCTDCHKANLQGSLFDDEGWLHGRYYAANLTLKAQVYSDEDLARIVRQGVRPDGRGVLAMPSFGFSHLRDQEMADIIAFVRSVPVGGPDQPDHFIGPLDRWNLWTVEGSQPAIFYVAGERLKEPADAGPQHADARHLTSIICRECHAGDLKGDGWGSGAPDLVVATAYGLPEFTQLLRTGIGADGKTHGLMTSVAKDRLYHLSDQEIAGIHAYLLARAALPR